METEISHSFINYDLTTSFKASAFTTRSPFPWYNFHKFLTPQGFQKLYLDFPCLELFEKHSGIERAYGQRSHDRYYLAYESSIYHQDGVPSEGKGIVKLKDLPITWQFFLNELETSTVYRSFIQSLLGVSDYRVRYAWHIGFNGSEVSPHIDSPDKIGTHILYFNTSEDWNADWGGSTLVLGEKQNAALNPDFSDFKITLPTQTVDNHSFLFKNAPNGWHGVEPLTCPESAYRRLFNVIFEFPKNQPSPNVGLRSLVKKILHR